MASKVGKYTVEVGFEANKQELEKVNRQVEDSVKKVNRKVKQSFKEVNTQASEVLDNAVKGVKKTSKVITKEIIDVYLKNLQVANDIERRKMLVNMKDIAIRLKNQHIRYQLSEQKRLREDEKQRNIERKQRYLDAQLEFKKLKHAQDLPLRQEQIEQRRISLAEKERSNKIREELNTDKFNQKKIVDASKIANINMRTALAETRKNEVNERREIRRRKDEEREEDRKERKEEQKRKKLEAETKQRISSIASFTGKAFKTAFAVGGVISMFTNLGAVSAEKAYTASTISDLSPEQTKGFADILAKRHIGEDVAYRSIGAIGDIRSRVLKGDALPNAFRALGINPFAGSSLDVIKNIVKQVKTAPQFKDNRALQASVLGDMGLSPELLKLTENDFASASLIKNTTQEIMDLQSAINTLSTVFNNCKNAAISFSAGLISVITPTIGGINTDSGESYNISPSYNNRLEGIKTKGVLNFLNVSRLIANRFLKASGFTGNISREMINDLFIKSSIGQDLISQGVITNNKSTVNNITINGEPTNRQVNQAKNIINSDVNANNYEMTTQGVFN